MCQSAQFMQRLPIVLHRVVRATAFVFVGRIERDAEVAIDCGGKIAGRDRTIRNLPAVTFRSTDDLTVLVSAPG